MNLATSDEAAFFFFFFFLYWARAKPVSEPLYRLEFSYSPQVASSMIQTLFSPQTDIPRGCSASDRLLVPII